MAALAASASAWFSYRTTRAAAMPMLSIQPTPDKETAQLALVVHNSGQGAAVNVITLSVVGDKYSKGSIGEGIIPAGESRTVVTGLAAPSGWEVVTAMVAYRSHRRRVHIVNTQGKRKTLGLRKSERGPFVSDLWTVAYPGTELPTPSKRSANV